MDLHLDATLDFLKQLQANNNREWFQAHRGEYEAAQNAFTLLVEELILGLSRYEDLGGIQPRDCIFRIYRDARFGKDKTPYKLNMGAVLARGGKKSPRASYYIHVQPGASLAAGGVYLPTPEQLKQIRQAIDRDHASLRRLLKRPSFRTAFGSLEDENMLKTIPRGYDPAHPAIDLLRLKSFAPAHSFTDKQVTARDFPTQVVQVFRVLKPLNDWLNTAMGA
jgi:uncharacterized protein (TIGR02453 family)